MKNQRIDRKIRPEIKKIEALQTIQLEEQKLNNGIPVYIINSGDQDVCKIDWVFDAGIAYQQKALVSAYTNSLLDEGTKKYSSFEIAEKLDFLGAFTNYDNSKFQAWFSVFSLNKYLNETLEICEQIIKHPIFPEKEIKIFAKKQQHYFLEDLENVEVIAREELDKMIFGANHIFGKKADFDDYTNISRNEIIDFHKKHYTAINCKIVVSGKIKENLIDILNLYFGKTDWMGSQVTKIEEIKIEPLELQSIHITKKNPFQTAIAMSKQMIDRNHPDFFNLMLLSAVLGGYFGSRLMKNIREDKGYTYGIGATYQTIKNIGFLVIQTQTAHENKQDVLNEIENEIKKLQSDPISEEELEMVKNYISGELLRSLDGPFSQSDMIKASFVNHFDFNYHIQFWNAIKKTSSKKLMDLAQKHLDFKTFKTVTVGQ